jgi:sugar diacid utilization regulator
MQRADAVRAELRRTQSQLRRLQLLRILDGSSPDSDAELDRRLDYRTGDVHLAMLLQGSDAGTLQREVADLRVVAGARGTLVLQNSPRSWFVWFGSHHGYDAAQLSGLRRALARTSFTVAVGEPAPGLEGLRQSYQQAFEAARLQQALGPAGGRCMWASDVRLEALLLRDRDRARQFVKAELGRLADDDAVAERLRETLLTWLATGSHVNAAALLQVHENTVRNRVRQAEELLGVALHQRRIELQVALRLERVLQAHELPHGELQPGRARAMLSSEGDRSWLAGPSAAE